MLMNMVEQGDTPIGNNLPILPEDLKTAGFAIDFDDKNNIVVFMNNKQVVCLSRNSSEKTLIAFIRLIKSYSERNSRG